MGGEGRWRVAVGPLSCLRFAGMDLMKKSSKKGDILCNMSRQNSRWEKGCFVTGRCM